MIGGIGMPELIIILVIILIIFGAGKLPEIGAGLGRGIKNFKKATKEVASEEKPDNLEENAPPKIEADKTDKV
ncbi:MAG: twin-arginine translocase TatA/TatE family subunit [Desulfobacula sp.]|jgi:sec-independent protein translocase protein TatA|nr:twin-arginine translocase TatA/TatE family subunit [Desulfobacula sp.]